MNSIDRPQSETLNTNCFLQIETWPDTVDAGGELTVRIKCDYEESSFSGIADLRIRDERGNVVKSLSISNPEERDEFCQELVLDAPSEPGKYTWTVSLSTQSEQFGVHDQELGEISFSVVPHSMDVLVWDVPSALNAGQRFAIKAGLRCSSGCNLANSKLLIHDDEGSVIAETNVGKQPWGGTTALYFSEVTLVAPMSEGRSVWRASYAGSHQPPHNAGEAEFGIRTVPQPDYEISVEVYDSERQTPVKGALVLMHPYRACTIENGVAKLAIAKGSYKLCVSGFKYIAYRRDLVAQEDMEIRVDLAKEEEGIEDYGS